MKLEFTPIPQEEIKEDISIDGEHIGQMRNTDDGIFVCCLSVKAAPLIYNFVTGRGETKESAITAAIANGTRQAQNMLESLSVFSGKLL